MQPESVASGPAGWRDPSAYYVIFGWMIFLPLIAVLVHLSEVHDDEAGMCFLEFGFGRASVPNSLKFRSLDAAQDWIAGRLTRPQS